MKSLVLARVVHNRPLFVFAYHCDSCDTGVVSARMSEAQCDEELRSCGWVVFGDSVLCELCYQTRKGDK